MQMKINQDIVTVPFNKKLSSQQQVLNEIVKAPGKYLAIAGAGEGKTYSMTKAFKEVSKLPEFKDYIFVLACPNSVQNLQNGSNAEYDITALVGGVPVDITKKRFSSVYDKLDELRENFPGRKIVFSVDEAHKLITDTYRGKALKMVEEMEKVATTVIHMTATPRKLLDLIEYTTVFKFENEAPINTINTLTLVQCENIDNGLLEITDRVIKSGIIPLIELNNVEAIMQYQEYFTAKGYNVGVLYSDEEVKHSLLYNSIVNKGYVPGEYDLILITSLLQCGTSLLNNNISVISFIDKATKYDPDGTVQLFNRARNLIENCYILTRDYSKTKKDIPHINYIKDYWISKVEKYKSYIEAGIELSKEDDTKEGIIKRVKGELSLGDESVFSKCRRCLKLNEEDLTISIDEKALTNLYYSEYDSNFVYNPAELLNSLKGHIRANNFEIEYLAADQEALEDLKEIKATAKEEKADTKEKAVDIINELKDDWQFKKYLDNQVDLEDIGNPVYKQIVFLKNEVGRLRLIKLALNNGISLENAIYMLNNYNDSEFKRKVTEFVYVQFNNSKTTIESERKYNVYRKVLDDLLKNRGRITAAKYMELIDQLAKIDSKAKSDYIRLQQLKDSVRDEDKKEKKKILLSAKGKMLKEISLIYNLKKNNEGYSISKLKTDFVL